MRVLEVLRDPDGTLETLMQRAPEAMAAIRATYDAIRASQLHTGLFSTSMLFEEHELFERCQRIHVLEPQEDPWVDVIEAYWCTLLDPLRLRIRFVDSWYYQQGEGGIHCATNTLRRPREIDDADLRWWKSYDPERDVGYDPAR
jgi:hypothetical protein